MKHSARENMAHEGLSRRTFLSGAAATAGLAAHRKPHRTPRKTQARARPAREPTQRQVPCRQPILRKPYGPSWKKSR